MNTPRQWIRIGTRGSPLALAQAGAVQRALERRFPDVRFEIKAVKTAGDEFQTVEIFRKTGVGVFTKAIEKKLLSGEIDIAVHSLKDLPTDLPAGLRLAAIPRRERSCDALVSRKRFSLRTLPKHAVVGAGSPRRRTQLALARPDLRLEDLRGNLDTRVRKVLDEKRYDAVIVAAAGLLRLRKYLKYAFFLSKKDVLPAAGQAALGVQIRKKDAFCVRLVRTLNHEPTERCAEAERVFLKELQGGCRVPVGVDVSLRGSALHMRAAVFSVQSPAFVRAEAKGPAKNGAMIAKRLAKILLKNGARAFLREARE